MTKVEVVSLRNIRMSFNGVCVLDGINLDLNKGEVHAIVGENGAGKSTLVKILMGVYKKTDGIITINNKQMPDNFDINMARENGINMVPQELALVPALSVGENILLGRKKSIFLSVKKIQEDSIEYIQRLGMNIDPSVRIDSLPISYRQMISIAKTCAEDANVVIMDEPTSSLSKDEVDELMLIIEKLKSSGKTIIYISHLLNEIFRISDRITVLRDGKLIKTIETKLISQRELISAMVGEDLLETQEYLRKAGENRNAEIARDKSVLMLELKNFQRRGTDKKVSLKLYKNEIVCVTGLLGSGKTELIRAILGIEKLVGGECHIHGQKVVIRSPQDAFKFGIATVPEDRKLEGLVLIRSVLENMSMSQTYRKKISKVGFINKRKEREDGSKYIEELNIKIQSLSQRVMKLSGGNQQKIVISKALQVEPQILIMDEATRGIDVGAKSTIYKLLHALKEKGVAVLYFSSDVSEMAFIGDYVLIMREGEIVKELSKREATIENMLNYMAGGAKNEFAE